MDQANTDNEPSKPLLVLDLDETLVSTISAARAALIDTTFMPRTLLDIELKPGCVVRYAVFKRPFVENFLRYVARFYRLALWSAGEPAYVQRVVRDILQPLLADVGVSFEFVWTSCHCGRADDYNGGERSTTPYVKNLAAIGEVSLSRVLLVDNNRDNALLQPSNHVGVPDFVASAADAWRDNWLPELAEFLELLSYVEDMRTVNKRWWTANVGAALVYPASPPPPPPLPRPPTPYDSLTALREWRLQRRHSRRGLYWVHGAEKRPPSPLKAAV